MASVTLFKFFKRKDERKEGSLLTSKEVESADRAVAKVLETASKQQPRGKYNSYTFKQRAEIGKYAFYNGASAAARHYSNEWGININESTARRLKGEYVDKLNEEKEDRKKKGKSAETEPVVIEKLPTKDRGRPLMLGEQLDAAVQEYVESTRKVNGGVNTLVVMGAAEGIVGARDMSKLKQIEITKSWARSLLIRMGYVKRKCTTSGKLPSRLFDESKEIFLADIAAEVVLNEVPKELIVNWDQTGLSIVPTSDWTMEKRGAKVVPIANTDDKRQLTAVLAVTASGEYLNPQLLYKGKTEKCHPTVAFPEGWDIWHSENRWANEDTTKRYIRRIIVPFVSQRRKDLKLKSTHPAITIFDGFSGQTTDDVVALLRQHNIIPVQLPPNCTDKLQPVDLSINKPMKDHMKQKFRQWYAAEVQKKLKTTPINEVQIDVSLSVIKNPSASWIVSGWQALARRPEVAINGFRKSGILDSIDI